MPKAVPQPRSLPHAVFLERASRHSATSPEVRLGQGAFLVLRMLDLLAPSNNAPVEADVFRYQWAATDRYARELGRGEPEAVHLQGLVKSAGDAHRDHDIRLLAPGLLAYAHYLEDNGQYLEAVDVVESTLRVGGDRLGATDRIAATLRLGRVLRKVMLFEEAATAYTEAGHLAESAGDGYSALLSRIGSANILFFRGNLGEAERSYRGILADSQAADNRDAEARAEHGLGGTLLGRGQVAESVPHLWRGFERYEEEADKTWILHDLGVALATLGDVTGAERALLEVVHRSSMPDVVNDSLVELMHCASFRRDRIGFERWRERCEASLDSMAPNMRADYLLKAGIGLARFGNFVKAEKLMGEALTMASANELHAMEFKIERIKGGLHECESEVNAHQGAPPTDAVTQSEPVREVSASLARLAEMTVSV